eukprot:gene8281-5800_t
MAQQMHIAFCFACFLFSHRRFKSTKGVTCVYLYICSSCLGLYNGSLSLSVPFFSLNCLFPLPVSVFLFIYLFILQFVLAYTGAIDGVVARAAHYYPYLRDGQLTPFQREKVAARRQARAGSRCDTCAAAQPERRADEESAIDAMARELTVDASGMFKDTALTERFSLRDLYRCRCCQLHISPSPAVEHQLPPGVAPELCHNILSLNFRSAYLGQKGVMALVAILPFCPQLESLCLSGVGICATAGDATHFISLLRAMQSCPKLRCVDLSCNLVDDNFGIRVMEMVQSHKHLTDLNLSRSGLCELVVNKAQRIIRERDGARTSDKVVLKCGVMMHRLAFFHYKYGKCRVASVSHCIDFRNTFLFPMTTATFRYVAAASDMDGTLLRPDHQLSEYAKSPRGRHHGDVLVTLRKLGLTGYVVTSNGGRVHDPEKRVVLRRDLPVALVKELVGMGIQDNLLATNIYQEDHWYMNKDAPDLCEYYETNKDEFYREFFDPATHPSYEGTYKVYYSSEMDHVDRLRIIYDKVVNRFGTQVTAAFSLPNCVEITSANVNKGTTLAMLLKQLLPNDPRSGEELLKNTITFGDGDNDRDMLLMAGKGCVMGNAQPQLLEHLPSDCPTLERIGPNTEDAAAHRLAEEFQLAV